MGRRIAVLGSTGSIGTQALEVITESRQLELHSIVCGSSRVALAAQKDSCSPSYAAAVSDGSETEILAKAMDGADMVLNAIVGSAGLKASLMAMERELPLALANKESLVVGSELLVPYVLQGKVIPVDSEHSTVFRCLLGEERTARRITLTASGGALRDMSSEDVPSASVEQVLAHPTWKMGGRITVDSASLVNKAFEVLEARALFPGIPVDAVIHRSSIVHSLVECADGAWKALLGLPNMKVPVAWALHYPDMPMEPVVCENPLQWGTLSFEPVDKKKYPCYRAMLSAGDMGGTAPCAANAADETAVAAFLERKISFGDIAGIIETVVESMGSEKVEDFDHLIEIDTSARECARKAVEDICSHLQR
ncbi:1-deoxy-D-xylulose-5-phosphate reductoisomerase [Candidatus Fermentibacteria bacterium]|nr:MAG: 1-deoxy-D-xylulose-5-phosphate reductoisomerase [Candidatus Fermentibacteria bacterium]